MQSHNTAIVTPRGSLDKWSLNQSATMPSSFAEPSLAPYYPRTSAGGPESTGETLRIQSHIPHDLIPLEDPAPTLQATPPKSSKSLSLLLLLGPPACHPLSEVASPPPQTPLICIFYHPGRACPRPSHMPRSLQPPRPPPTVPSRAPWLHTHCSPFSCYALII